MRQSCQLVVLSCSLLFFALSPIETAASGLAMAGAGEVSFVTGKETGRLRSDFSGLAGMRFTVGAQSLLVHALGRHVAPSNSRTHLLKLVLAATGADVQGGSILLPLSGGTIGQFKYAPLPNPVRLNAHTAYYLVAEELAGGDPFHDIDTTVTARNVATVDSGVYQQPGEAYAEIELAPHTYGPVDFKYTVVPPPAPPTVALTQPASGASYFLPTNISLQATASTDVTNVEFVINGVQLGARSSAPFSLLWTNPMVGNFSVVARARANTGLSVTSSMANITVRNVPPVAGAADGFVTSVDPMLLRNDFSGFIGMVFTVGNRSVVVSRLGRMMIEGNTRTHQLKLVSASSGLDVSNSTVTVSMAGGTPGAFIFAPLPARINLAPNTMYYLVSSEVVGGDEWYDVDRTTVTTSDVGTADAGVFQESDDSWVVGGLPGHSYGPLSFEYIRGEGLPPVSVQLAEPAPFTYDSPATLILRAEVSDGVTNVQFFANGVRLGSDSTPNPFRYFWNNPPLGDYELSAVAMASNGLSATSPIVSVSITTNFAGLESSFVIQNDPRVLRNDFTGFLGFVLNVGSNSITVSRLGRYVIPGNSETHRLKLVRANDGQDVPGTTVSVDLAGATPDRFAYAYLPMPVILPARSRYYVVSEETAGGDQWYDGDRTKIETTDAGLAEGGVYGAGGSWTVGGLAGHSYVPVDFKYLPTEGLPEVTVDILRPAPGTSFRLPTNIVLEAAASAGVELVEYFRGPTKLGQSTLAPFRFTWTAPPLGDYLLRAIATASNGLLATSAVVNISVTTNIVGVEASFVLSKDAKSPRNDYAGFVGFALRVGPNPLDLTRLGRLFTPGNDSTHRLKIVRADTGEDLPGALVTVSMAAGGVDGEFVYSVLPATVRLDALTTYYLVSEETIGGDMWYDLERTSVFTSPVATVEAGVYRDASGWVVGGLAGQSYGPLDFKYLVNDVLTPRPSLQARVTGGQFQIELFGFPGYTYIVESTADFVSWTELGRYTPGNGSSLIDLTISGNTQRFFRARLAN